MIIINGKFKSLRKGSFVLLMTVIIPVMATVLSGCKKDDLSLGIDLLPGVKTLETRNYTDSTSISAYTFLDNRFFLVDTNTINTPRYYLLGSFNDPLFGYTNGSFGAQFRMPFNPKFESDAVLDSVILQMSYKYVYGDTITSQTIIVRELADSLQYGVGYLSTYNIRDHVLPAVLGSRNIVPKFRTDSLRRDTASQIIRIRLDPSLGNRLLTMDSVKTANNDVFLKEFKGLFVETAPLSRRGALMRIDAPSNFLIVHYHTAAHDSLAYAYRISDNSAGVPGYQHDYTSTPFFANLNQQTGNDSLVYLQPTGGTKVRLNIPGLTEWKDSTNYIINKATLSFHIDTLMTDMRRYEIPPQLYLKVLNNDGEEEFPKDKDLSAAYYGGFYNPITRSYNFNITQHLQQIIKGEKQNNGFVLVPAERNTSPKRVVLKNSNTTKPELNVVYTRYKLN